MATLVQIGEGAERANRAASLEPKNLLEDPASQLESQPTTSNDAPSTTHRIRTLLRALAGTLIAPVLLVAALTIFLVALADFSLFRLRDLRNGHPHPKGLWEF